MLQPGSPFQGAIVASLALVLLAGCDGCSKIKVAEDAGPDAGEGEGEEGEGEGEGEGEEGEGEGEGEGEPACSESTEGYGEACGECGVQICNPIEDTLVCNDPGVNDCGVCDPPGQRLDESAGGVGEACGEEGCGTGVCNGEGTATICIGADIERNACGGCSVLTPIGADPGDVCSGCGTGRLTCTVDQEALACFRGREFTNDCGTCDRCVLSHAFMQDRSNGSYLLPGTTAIIESVDNTPQGRRLVFDPLIAGPGACCLPQAQIYLSIGPDPFSSFSRPLQPNFANTATDTLLADPVRTFVIPSTVNLEQFRYVALVDASLFLDPVLALGEIVAGAPPVVDVGEGEGEGE